MRLSLAVLAALIAAPAFAQGEVPDYLDDRSSPEAVVQSLYNAINRSEYLRAWSYYGGNAYARDDDEEAQSDYEAMKTLYEEPAFFEVLTGNVTEEGAAGSTYSYVPVALKVSNEAGESYQLAGCYTVRLAQPTNQDAPPYHPMHIVGGELELADDTSLESILPSDCTP
jgi:hypothetical protein